MMCYWWTLSSYSETHHVSFQVISDHFILLFVFWTKLSYSAMISHIELISSTLLCLWLCESKDGRCHSNIQLKFNSVWLPLVDVVEYCVVFAPKVFVQSFGVSCHCGLQSTVVHSRVCHCSRGDLQMHFGFIITHFDRQSIVCVILCSIVKDKELWWFSWILSIPEEIITSSSLFGVCVGQSNSAVF